MDTEGSGEPLVAPGHLLPFSLVTSLFFMWGVPNNLNDVLIRQFMKSFALNRVEAGLVQSAFYLGYFFLAMPAALIMRRSGIQDGLITGLLLFATGAGLFWPAAIVGRYWFFLIALFVIAIRTLISRNRVESLHHPDGRPGNRRAPAQLLAGLQSARVRSPACWPAPSSYFPAWN